MLFGRRFYRSKSVFGEENDGDFFASLRRIQSNVTMSQIILASSNPEIVSSFYDINPMPLFNNSKFWSGASAFNVSSGKLVVSTGGSLRVRGNVVFEFINGLLIVAPEQVRTYMTLNGERVENLQTRYALNRITTSSQNISTISIVSIVEVKEGDEVDFVVEVDSALVAFYQDDPEFQDVFNVKFISGVVICDLITNSTVPPELLSYQ